VAARTPTLTQTAALASAALAAAFGLTQAWAGGTVLQTQRIDDWQAVSDTEIVITTNSGRRYRAVLMSPCLGLRFTDRIAFVTRGERQIDRFAGIQLPDGTRCFFKSLTPVSRPTESPAQSTGTPAR
jgi:hypothetical protein